MKLELSNFKGMMPKVAPEKLTPGYAVRAVNCQYENGNLRSIDSNVAVDPQPALAAGIIKSLFLYERSFWLSWSADIDAAISPVENDSFRRLYYTGEGKPKITYNSIATGPGALPSASFDLGIPAPETAITFSITLAGDTVSNTDNDITQFYRMTYASALSEEGAPGPVSLEANLDSPNATVNLSLPTIATNNANIAFKRIYRSVTSGTDTQYYLIAELPLAQATFVDTGDQDPVKPLDTTDYFTPPEDGKSLTMGANGIACMLSKNGVYFSSPYELHAWPVVEPTEHDTVAVKATTTGFVVGTEGYPYIFTGLLPGSITGQKLELMQACVSARSMVDMGAIVVYASPDGLVAINESSVQLLTRDVFSKESWAAYQPETIRAYRYEHYYIGFYGSERGFVFDLNTSTFTELDFYATAGFSDILTDQLYLVVGGELVIFDSGEPMNKDWLSSVVKTPTALFNWCRVHSESPEKNTFTWYADGNQVYTYAPPDERFRLPMVRAKRWQLRIQGTGETEAITLADNPIES